MKSSGEFNATLTRNKLKGNVVVDREKLMNYPFKPFDLRVAYLDNNIAPLFSRPSPELLNSMGNNIGLLFPEIHANKPRKGRH